MILPCRISLASTWALLLSIIQVSEQGAHERRLLADLGLYDNNENIGDGVSYNKYERPVFNESAALAVHFGLVLQQIIDLDEKNQILISSVWLNMIWNDYGLVWNESEYGGVKSIRVPPSMVWTPDVLMYNSADEDIDSTFATNVVISSNGDCLWVPPGIFFSTCRINIAWFPFDEQECLMKFGSWTHDSSGIDLWLQSQSADISGFSPNGEWQLLEMPAKRNIKSYDCCPEMYVDVTYSLRIRRRTLYYGFNLIIPCVLISSMALLAFTLPPDAGEKISLGVTVLLSLTVFLLLVAETMPPTSDDVPLIGIYFAFIMFMCSLSVVFTVLVLNYHHRSPSTHEMPTWVRVIICEWLAWIMRMHRPGRKLAFSELRRRLTDNKASQASEQEISNTWNKQPIGRSSKDRKSDGGALSISQLLSENSAPAVISFASESSGSNQRPITNTTSRPLRCSPKASSYSTRANRILNSQIAPVNETEILYDEKELGNGKIPQLYQANHTGSVQGYVERVNDKDRFITLSGFNSASSNLTPSDELVDTRRDLENHKNSLLVTKRRGTQSAQSSPAHSERRNQRGENSKNSSQVLGSSQSKNFLTSPEEPDRSPAARTASTEQKAHRDSVLYDLLTNILGELRQLTEKSRLDDENEEMCNEWKFAAMVVDRMCLFVFTGMTVASTFGILFSSSHISA